MEKTNYLSLYDYNRIKKSVINPRTNEPYSFSTYKNVVAGKTENKAISKAIEHYFNVIVPNAQKALTKFVIEYTNKTQI